MASIQPARSSIELSERTPSRLSVSAPAEAIQRPPNGGLQAWLVIFGCSVMNFATGGTYCFGIVQARLVLDQVAAPTTLSWLGSVWPTLMATLAILASKSIRSLGARPNGIAGAILLSLGLTLSGFTSRNIGGLFVTSGVLTGIGAALIIHLVNFLPAQYFDTRRGIATGVVFACAGLGGGVISLAMGSLIDRVGVNGMFYVLGGVTFATAVPASLLIKERTPYGNRQFIDLKLFADPRFLLLTTSSSIAILPLFAAPFLLPLLTDSLGLPSSKGVASVAIFNFSSAFGRLLFGFVSDKIGPFNSLLIGLSLNALSLLAIWPSSTSFGVLVLFCILSGGANGSFFSLMPGVVGTVPSLADSQEVAALTGKVFGGPQFSVTMAMLTSFWTFGYLLGAPIAGYLLEAFGGQEAGIQAFRPAMYVSGSLTAASAIMIAFVRMGSHRGLFSKA